MKIEQYENTTLYCGDCREVFDALPTVQAVITDPPYGIRYETRRKKFMERPGTIENDISALLWCVPLITGNAIPPILGEQPDYVPIMPAF